MKKQIICSITAIICLSGILLVSCKQNNAANVQATDQTVTSEALPADFEVFYEKFHQDSLYQVAHITWPLDGNKGLQVNDSTTSVQSVKWQASEWRMQKLDLINSGDFIREVTPIGDLLVLERIRAKAVPFGIERRFAKQANGEWELIFYADVFEFKQ